MLIVSRHLERWIGRDWQMKVAKEFGLESTLRTRGRPRKGAEK
ncbi:MAG: hypothetical protein AB1606_04855 [Nitrospirota bacterium]